MNVLKISLLVLALCLHSFSAHTQAPVINPTQMPEDDTKWTIAVTAIVTITTGIIICCVCARVWFSFKHLNSQSSEDIPLTDVQSH